MDRKINIFDKIGTLIPGYKGYQERDGRRECDRQLRENIADFLSEAENLFQKQIEKADFNLISTIEKLRKKISNLRDLIKYAPYGASSFFSDSEIKEDELDIVYRMDLTVLQFVCDFKEKIAETSLLKIEEQIQQLEDSVNKRNQYLKNI